MLNINYSEGGICNYKCCYCRSKAKRAEGFFDADIGFYDLFFIMKKKGLLSSELNLDYAPGESTLHHDRLRTYELFNSIESVQVFTNASIYDEVLSRYIENDRCVLLVSVDAGTRETYHKVKGSDLYDKVQENLRKYSALRPGIVQLKYIFLPGINDNDADVDGFIELCHQINPGIVFLSFDYNYPGKSLPDSTFRAVKRMIDTLDSEQIIWQSVSDLITQKFQG